MRAKCIYLSGKVRDLECKIVPYLVCLTEKDNKHMQLESMCLVRTNHPFAVYAIVKCVN